MLYAAFLFAQADQGKNGGGQQDPFGGLGMFLPLILIMLAFFFLIVMPARRRERIQREALFGALKKNDKVLTTAGIIGIVANVEDDEVTLKVDESANVRLRMLKSSIVRIIGPKETKEGGAPDTSVKSGPPPSK
jgi:preprotein translocase subunit YajC